MVLINRKSIASGLVHTRSPHKEYEKEKKDLALIVMVILLALTSAVWMRRPSFEPPEGVPFGGECELWMAESSVQPGALGVFSGVERTAGKVVTERDIMFALFEVNTNENSPWQDYTLRSDIAENLNLETHFTAQMVVPGLEAITINMMAPCSDAMVNVEPERQPLQDSLGVNRWTNPTAGSFEYRYNWGYKALKPLRAGEEIIVPCTREKAGHLKPEEKSEPPHGKPVLDLQDEGVCIDNLAVAPSTLPDVGRGAFAKRAVAMGDVITPTPVLHFDRSQMEVVDQTLGALGIPRQVQRAHGIRYSENVVGYQLALNYCYGHPNSTILLLPIGPGVNFINHSREKANAIVDWSQEIAIEMSMFETSPHMVVNTPSRRTLVLDIVATRNIKPGEEIFLDYGDAWQEAWDNYVSEWQPRDEGYIDAVSYTKGHADEPFKTQAEQDFDPYPENIQTACYLMVLEEDSGKVEMDYSVKNLNCLRYCTLVERSGGDEGREYTVVAHPNMNHQTSPFCRHVPPEGITVHKYPEYAIRLIDKPYTTDAHLGTTFRHEIGISEGMYPDLWMYDDPNPTGEVAQTPVEVGEVAPVRWKDNDEIIHPMAFRIGLPSHTRDTLKKFAVDYGIEEFYRTITIGGNALTPGYATDFELKKGDHWMIYRPNKDWTSNLQWLFTNSDEAERKYMSVLKEAGFDEVLDGIGKAMGFKGLTAFHFAFIGVSHSAKGHKHADVTGTGNRTFNVIIPLQLANETGPELEFTQALPDGTIKVGRYKYEYGVGQMIGDSAIHATSGADYRPNKEFRYAASIYVCDIGEDNVDAVSSEI
jgi:hypothetical protein